MISSSFIKGLAEKEISAFDILSIKSEAFSFEDDISLSRPENSAYKIKRYMYNI